MKPLLKKVSGVGVERLLLDHENPRLVNFEGQITDEEIIAHLYRAEDLGELLDSIAANGYLDIEPFIVLVENNNDLIVLEGNRRFAAIRLFREPDLVDKIWEQTGVRIPLPEFARKHLDSMKRVSVYSVDNRKDARAFIGFKHINGAAKWESYAKAKFASDWYRVDNISLSEIASRIGDRHDTVKRMIHAIFVLEQARATGMFNIEDRVSPRFNFSHLYTALSRAPYMKHIGLDSTWLRDDPIQNPVPVDKLDHLSELLRWIFGSKNENFIPVVQVQNPDIKHLGEVIASNEGLSVLRASRSLVEAHASTQSANRRFSEALLRTRKEIREASNSLRGFDGDDLSQLGIAEDISETAQAIHGRMLKKMNKKKIASE